MPLSPALWPQYPTRHTHLGYRSEALCLYIKKIKNNVGCAKRLEKKVIEKKIQARTIVEFSQHGKRTLESPSIERSGNRCGTLITCHFLSLCTYTSLCSCAHPVSRLHARKDTGKRDWKVACSFSLCLHVCASSVSVVCRPLFWHGDMHIPWCRLGVLPVCLCLLGFFELFLSWFVISVNLNLM